MWKSLGYQELEWIKVPLLEYKSPKFDNFWLEYMFDANFDYFCIEYNLNDISDKEKFILKRLFYIILKKIRFETDFNEVKSYLEKNFNFDWIDEDFSVYIDLLKEYFRKKVLDEHNNLWDKRNIAHLALIVWNIKASIAIIIDDFTFWVLPLECRTDKEKTVL